MWGVRDEVCAAYGTGAAVEDDAGLVGHGGIEVCRAKRTTSTVFDKVGVRGLYAGSDMQARNGCATSTSWLQERIAGG